MTAVHRPLSDWVVRIGPPSSGPNLINDGDERADARHLPLFAEGWVRRSVTAGPGHTPVLALHSPVSSLTYVELDDYGAPLSLEQSGTELINRIETSWPNPDLGPADLAAVATLSRQIRYLLLHRLSQEGSPAPGVYHSLPWGPVAELASAVVRMLDEAQPSPLSEEALDLGHWVTPAAVGVTGPLEQLYEGLADPDPVLTARGGTALCSGLNSADPARFPAPVRGILADVVRRLASVNPFLRHAATLAADRLTGFASTGLVTTLDSDLPKAAAGTDDRTAIRRLGGSGPFSVRAEVTASGRLKITVQLSVEATTERNRLLDLYGCVFAPVTVSAGDLSRRYWVALEARRRWMSGTLDVPAEHGRFDVGAQEAVIGVWGLSGVSPDELLVSLTGADRAGLQVWRAAAERVPTGHPLHRAVRRHDGQRGTS
ncbi:hypothetical protein [Streptomyces sp. SID5643]|uniref:hypothetical protein n=1 Tax=Streptomyces sp. SID5643 TaxID=2690307 RepID=UPI0013695259|nr:hypothetical protein [Streptomyces sp. SID5643]MZF87520.1 hypothetical protein [Streptomyces sp. SID5643]